MNPILACLFILIFICIAVFFARSFWPLLLRTRTTARGIEVCLLGLVPAIRIRFEDIIEVRPLSFRGLLPWSNTRSTGWLRLGMRFGSGGVLIRKKSGPFKNIVVTPDDIEAFVNEVRSKQELLHPS